MSGAATQVRNGSGPGPDRRSGRRFTLILRAAKLICPAGEFLCVLRDVSERGLKARLFHPLPHCPSWEIELGSGVRLAIEPVWRRDRDIGFRFAGGPIDVGCLLQEAGPFPKRSIRLRLGCEVMVGLDTERGQLPARLRDISQQGALLESRGQLALGEKVRIAGCGIPVLHGRVRWRRKDISGVVFQRGFRLDELARLVAWLQIGEDLPAGIALRA